MDSPFPGVNALLQELLDGVRCVLGARFIGLYCYGSLALGDFDPESSDIDFVVVTADEISAQECAALAALHQRIARHHPRWAMALEGSYVPQAAMRRYDPERANHLHLFEGKLAYEEHGVHWVIERYVLRAHGLVLIGPAPEGLIDPISPMVLRQAVIDLLRTWWAPMIDSPHRLVDPAYQRYAVVTMCRALYTLEHGDIATKPKASRWASETLEPRWQRLIEASLQGSAAAELIAETCNFILYTLAHPAVEN